MPKINQNLPRIMIIENDWIPKVKDLVKYDGDLCIRITKDDLNVLTEALGEKYLKQYNLISKDKNYLKLLGLDDMDKFWIYPLAKDYFRKKTNCNAYYWAKNLKELQEIMGEKVLDHVLSGIKFLLKKTNRVSTKKSTINKKLQSIAKRLGVPPYSSLVRASTELKPFSYKGKTITASSREEAISKIIASNEPTIDGNLSTLSNDIIKQVSEFSTELKAVIKKLRMLERARKCSWNVVDIQKTDKVFSFKFWVVNNKEESRNYILSLENGLLSDFKAYNVDDPTQNLKGSVARDIENFVG